jgi:hypothetical protein
MTTKKDGQTGAQGAAASNRLAGAIDPSGKIKLANREKAFQLKLEKMQINLLQRDLRYKKSVAKGLRELVNAKKMDQLLAEHKVKPLTDFSHLKEIYDGDLKTISAEDLKREAEAKAETFLSGGNKVSAEQERMVRELFALEARTNELGIEQIRDFLILKGNVAEKPGDKKRIREKENMIKEPVAA